MSWGIVNYLHILVYTIRVYQQLLQAIPDIRYSISSFSQLLTSHFLDVNVIASTSYRMPGIFHTTLSDITSLMNRYLHLFNV